MIRQSSKKKQSRAGFLSLLGVMKRGQKRRYERQMAGVSVESAVVNTAVESLEDRTLLDASHFDTIFAPGTDPAYIQSIEGDTHEPFQIGGRWTETATDGAGLQQGDPTTLTWTIAADGVTIPGFNGEATAGSDLISFMDSIYGSASGSVADRPWFTFFEDTFNRIGEVSGVTYVYVTYDDGSEFNTDSEGELGVQADIRIGGHAIDGPSGILAYNFLPDVGDMVIDTTEFTLYGDTTDNSLILRNVIAHEAGHGLGLLHVEPITETILMEPFLTTAFDGYQFDDILALNRLYGDALEKGDGNDTFQTAFDVGIFAPGDAGTIGDDAVDTFVAPGDTDFLSIDGISDEDFIAFTIGEHLNVSLALVPLGPTYDQGPQGGTAAEFDASMQNNLAFQVLDTDGVTVLATGDALGLGETELLIQVDLAVAGTYFIRIYGEDDAAQFYQLGAEFAAGPGLPQGPVVELRWDTSTFFEEADTNRLIATLVDPITGETVDATEDVEIFIDFSGTGLLDIDYFVTGVMTLNNYVIQIAEGDSEGELTVTGIDDLIRETPEIIYAEVVAVFGASEIGNEKVSTFIEEGVPDDPVIIIPPSPPTIELSISDASFSENGGTATITVSLDIPPTELMAIRLGYTGTATYNNDYSENGGFGGDLLINAGTRTATITLTGLDDLVFEGDETIIVTLLSDIDYIIKDGFQQVSTTILDNDLPYPVVTLTTDTNNIPEYWGVVTYTATLDRIYATDTTITFSFSGDAVRGVDYGLWQPQIVIPAGMTVGQFQAQAIPDAIQETEETFTVTVADVNGFVQDGSEFETVVINDDDLIKPNVTLTALPTPIAEYWGVSTVTATLNQTSALDTIVNLGLSGTATLGSDYGAWMTQIVIPAGQTSGSIQLQAIPDSIIDGDETIIVDITSVINGNESGVQQETVTIIDDDLPNISLSTSLSEVTEYWKLVNIIATTDSVSSSDITVNVAFAGTATLGTDYGAWNSQIVIPAGQTSGSIQIQTISDGIIEIDESVIVSIVTVTNGLENGNQQKTITIKDETSPEVSLTSNVTSINEYWGVATFTATQDAVSTIDTIVNINYTGTAIRGTDYGAWQTQIIIPAGELSGQMQVQAMPDSLIESNESIRVSVGSVVNATLKDGAQSVSVLINNDDSGVVTMTDPITSLKSLVVAGTSGADVIRIRQTGSLIQVSMNSVDQGTFSGVETLIVNGGDGNDTIILEDSVLINATISGGKGNDNITGGSGHDIIKGDEGNDVLNGGALGRDLIIGGDGGDQFNVNPLSSSSSTDGDLMIAGTSKYETELNNLFAIHQEWSSNKAFATRVSNLKNGAGVPRLDANTVMNDFDLDDLFSTPGQDWFLFTPAHDNVNSSGGDQLN